MAPIQVAQPPPATVVLLYCYESCLYHDTGISAATEEEEGGGPGFHTQDRDAGSAMARRQRRRDKDPGSRPGIYNLQKSVVNKDI
jgi:hypothetical protein